MKSKRQTLNIVLTVIFIITLVLFMLTFSIGLPIYGRFFYYIQINTLGMPEKTGYDYATIKAAYDEVLNYLTLPNCAFGTRSLKWSKSGAAHFADCKVLFDLNFWVLLVSGLITLALVLLNRFKVITLCRPFGRGAYLISAVVAIALPVIIALLAVIVGFDAAFEAFHAIFFPGKTNWIFNPSTDEIIKVMPEEFFLNCAIIIGVGLVTFAAALIVADCIVTSRKKRRETTEGEGKENSSLEGNN